MKLDDLLVRQMVVKIKHGCWLVCWLYRQVLESQASQQLSNRWEFFTLMVSMLSEFNYHNTIHTNYHYTIHTNYHYTIHTNYHNTIHTNYHNTIHTNYHNTIHTNYHNTIHTCICLLSRYVEWTYAIKYCEQEQRTLPCARQTHWKSVCRFLPQYPHSNFLVDWEQ